MPQDGLYWYKSLSGISQRLSAMAKEFDGLADDVVEDAAKAGAKTMTDLMGRYQQTDGVITGGPVGPPTSTGDMRDSINYEVGRNAKGRSTANFGFVDGYQDYFRFKEEGLGHMIPMHSMAQGYLAAQTALDNGLAKAGAEIKTYWQDVFL